MDQAQLHRPASRFRSDPLLRQPLIRSAPVFRGLPPARGADPCTSVFSVRPPAALPPVELQLPQLSRGPRRQRSGPATHAILHRPVRRRRALDPLQRLARHPCPDRRLPGPPAGASAARYGDRRDRPARQPDRPHHRPAQPARRLPARSLVHADGPPGPQRRLPAVPHAFPLERRPAPPADRPRWRAFRHSGLSAPALHRDPPAQ